eukprot:TRINITY_DN24308_c0_g1_i2.p1 TRINITY_DN24308_c0_g1~~TRINITY_DN24308_c0_g1_i2.p1  ORF type:complete len:201 (+),score=42.37 TRINITY_DN24308_c0_g1_i2:133-735(+)
MLRSLVGSEMCIRDRYQRRVRGFCLGAMLIDIQSPGIVGTVKQWVNELSAGERHPGYHVLREVWVLPGSSGGWPLICVNYDWHNLQIHSTLQRRCQDYLEWQREQTLVHMKREWNTLQPGSVTTNWQAAFPPKDIGGEWRLIYNDYSPVRIPYTAPRDIVADVSELHHVLWADEMTKRCDGHLTMAHPEPFVKHHGGSLR